MVSPWRAAENHRIRAVFRHPLGMHVSPTAVVAALSVTALVACGGAVTGAAAPSTDPTRTVTAQGTFAAPPATPATYDNALIPAGATATVSASEAATATSVTLTVAGLQPNRRYGAHAHTKPCGSDGKDAGPHFQLKPDPVTPSVDPAYANNVNEIWLDFTTDAAGAGHATSTVPWTVPADRRAASVIIHAMPTATDPGKAGSAGNRVACITVGF
jgi:Cu-Zn family superoxide dismutase